MLLKYPHRARKLLVPLLALGLGLGTLPSVTTPARADTYFPQTMATLWGPFEVYWNTHGGMGQFGMPRTNVFPTKDGYDAQYFERAQFTYNPRNADPYKVQLQLLGSLSTASRKGEAPFKPAPAPANPQNALWFPETQHNLSGKFLDYWRTHGGLPIYGFPISEAFTEKSKSDGKQYLVQYFERNRFELHPEAAGTPYEVQLGLLGSEMLDAQGGPSAFANLGAPNYYPAPSGGATVPPTTYPKVGHAADYSWIAGQVAFTRIQGGCIFIRVNDETFAPNGQGWQPDKVKNGDYVVVFGHIAQPGEPIELCPGGRPYTIERTMLNP